MTSWSEEIWDRVERALACLQSQWRSGGEVGLQPLVPAPDEACRLQVLIALIQVDLEHRWDSPSQRRLEAYLQDWPELARDVPTLSKLVAAECRVRRARGDRPTPDELAARFPLLENHRDLTTEASEGRSLFDRIGSRCGRYRVLRKLGHGGMGTVYQARDDELDRTVAIKLLDRRFDLSLENHDLLLQEARTVAKLRHPAIVPVYDMGTTAEGESFLVMEYVQGDSLAHRLASGRVAHVLAVNVTIQLADALGAAHEQGFLHRDVKPANVLLEPGDRVRVTDFGLALRLDEFSGDAARASGTLPYMAPEQLRGQQVDARSDIWAIGVILYEMLTGRPPFLASSPEELGTAIIEREPVPPRAIDDRISRRLETTCLKCLRKAAAERYSTVAGLIVDLQKAATCFGAGRRNRGIGMGGLTR
jgi:predicted Ser/Thr protein kinase